MGTYPSDCPTICVAGANPDIIPYQRHNRTDDDFLILRVKIVMPSAIYAYMCHITDSLY